MTATTGMVTETFLTSPIIIDESSDSLRPITLFMHSYFAMLSFVCFLCPAILVCFGVHIHFHLPHSTRPDSRNTKLKKIISLPLVHLDRIAKYKGFFEICAQNFIRRLMVVNFPCTDWLSYLRTQLNLWVEFV